MLAACPDMHCLRDATRGGLATVLNEFAQAARRSASLIDEAALPVRDEVRGACEILGLDPLYMANEGKLVAVVPRAGRAAVLAAMRAHPAGREAAVDRRGARRAGAARRDAHRVRRRAHRRHAGRRPVAEDLLMHELGITQSIVAICAKRSGRRAGGDGSRLEIGRLSGVLPDAVRFCFEVCCQGTPLEGAVLDVHHVAARGRCRACGAEMELHDWLALCDCGSRPTSNAVGGDELQIKDMEIA